MRIPAARNPSYAALNLRSFHRAAILPPSSGSLTEIQTAPLPDICVPLGRRIRTSGRDRAGQFEMSERLGIDRSYLAEVETGKIEACLRNLALIAQAFGRKA